MKKIFALLLVFAMIFSFAACGEDSKSSDSPKKSSDKKGATIVGTWKGEFEYKDIDMNVPLDDDKTITLPNPKVTFVLTLTKDTASFSIDEKSFEKYVDECAETMKNELKKYIGDICEEGGISMDEFVAAIGYGSIDEFLNDSIEEAGFTSDAILEQLSEDLIYFTDIPYTYKNNKITFEYEGEEQEIIVKSVTKDKLVTEIDFGEDAGVQNITFKK